MIDLKQIGILQMYNYLKERHTSNADLMPNKADEFKDIGKNNIFIGLSILRKEIYVTPTHSPARSLTHGINLSLSDTVLIVRESPWS